MLELCISSLGLALCACALVVIAPLIKFGSPGPVFYRQTRIGREGRPFKIYKLRSMVVGCAGPPVTSEGDPRITPVGRVIRRWKLDELPQFWNVLVGDMRLIGPRPEVPELVARYTADQARILECKPGLAGMAQLVYPNESRILSRLPDPARGYVELLLPKKLAVDLAYEQVRTFRSDVDLMFRIARMVLGLSRPGDRALHRCTAGEDHAACARAATCPVALARARARANENNMSKGAA